MLLPIQNRLFTFGVVYEVINIDKGERKLARIDQLGIMVHRLMNMDRELTMDVVGCAMEMRPVSTSLGKMRVVDNVFGKEEENNN